MTGSRKALVTGAAVGLGLAMTRQLLASGFHVIALDRDGAALERLREQVGGRLDPVTADLADLAALDALGADLASRGPYQRVVMNAGINATGAFETIPFQVQDRLIAVNLTAPMTLTAVLVREGAIVNGGCLVFVSSLSRFVGYPGAATYAATKEGIAVFARSLRKPLARRKIKVLTVCPGPLDTAHADQHAPEGADASKRMKPDEAARHVLAAANRPALAGLFLGGGVSVPGIGPKFIALAGRLLPAASTAMMRRIIFEKF